MQPRLASPPYHLQCLHQFFQQLSQEPKNFSSFYKMDDLPTDQPTNGVKAIKNQAIKRVRSARLHTTCNDFASFSNNCHKNQKISPSFYKMDDLPTDQPTNGIKAIKNQAIKRVRSARNIISYHLACQLIVYLAVQMQRLQYSQNWRPSPAVVQHHCSHLQ